MHSYLLRELSYFLFPYLLLDVDESMADKMRSILAQLDYKYQVDCWCEQGIPFRNHLYVPEIHPVTKMGFCEREDEGHVFKVIVVLCWIILFNARHYCSVLGIAYVKEGHDRFNWRDLKKLYMTRYHG